MGASHRTSPVLAEKYVTNPCMMMQGGSQAIREGLQQRPEEADEVLSPQGRQAIESHAPPWLRPAPAQHTPPSHVRHICA